MYILNIVNNTQSTTRIFGAGVDENIDKRHTIEEQELTALLGGEDLIINEEKSVLSENRLFEPVSRFSKMPIIVSSQLVIMILQTMREQDNKSTRQKLEAEYELTEYEIEFISKLVGEIKTYANLTRYIEECGMTKSINVGFWLMNASGEWVSVEDFCSGDLVMGYVLPSEIVSYIGTLQNGNLKIAA